MKKLVLTATFALATLGAFAANGEVKSNNPIVPVKNNIAVLKDKFTKHPLYCAVSVDLGIITVTFNWECN
jgi:hypothetical protein